ncbi:MAG: formate C-acetyltransferase/glycerol dehydratase family glycyl radical enzyme [Thermodesulfobacteriota bacterium]
MDQKLRSKILASLRMPRLRIEKALIVTQAHKDTEGEPMIIRRAKVFRELAKKMPISIDDWQLIVGNFSSEPFAVSPHPEAGWRDIVAGLDEFGTRDGDKCIVTEEDKSTLRKVLPWWEGKSIQDVAMKILPEDVRGIYEAGVSDTGYFTQGSGSFSADYPKIIQKGFVQIKGEIQAKLDELDLTVPGDIDKWVFYRATLICCDGAMEYAARYAKLAREMAQKERRPQRENELLQIAEICERVPNYPARDFREAAQVFWFVHVLLHYEVAGGAGIVAGRLDQYLYPYMKGMEREEVKKWLKNLWINYNQVMLFLPGRAASNWSGYPVSEQPTIGGIDYEGNDASNELTELILEVEKEVAMPQPDIAVMYHKKINRKVMEKACETLSISMKPKFFMFETAAAQARERGITNPKDLADLVDIGCVAVGPQGKSWGNNGVGFFNLGKVLELTLNNGIDPATGKRVGLETGDAVTFTNYDQFYEAFKKQLAYCNKLTIKMINIIEKVHMELNPQPFTSILIDDCLEKGLPVWKGGARYNIPGVEAVGLANVADSLAAVKKLVFDDKSTSMAELLEALRNNFEGKWERLQQRLINVAPKFGNDEDYVDEIASDVAAFYCKEHNKYEGFRGKYCPSICSVSAHVGLGRFIGALPDGRTAGRPLADGMSPVQGVCKNGPTAIIKSLSKIDQRITSNGNLLNMKFNSGILKHESTRDKFISLLETYLDLGGFHVQFNFIDTALLKEAQANPAKYPELTVRVAAYVAQFGQLPKELQDDIIARSELGL